MVESVCHSVGSSSVNTNFFWHSVCILAIKDARIYMSNDVLRFYLDLVVSFVWLSVRIPQSILKVSFLVLGCIESLSFKTIKLKEFGT